MRKHEGLIDWHRKIEIATWVCMASIIVLLLLRSRFFLVPLPIICALAVVKSIVTLRQYYLSDRQKKPVSAVWLLSLVWHIVFAGGTSFFVWVTSLLAFAWASSH
jgi:membrane-anchored glycerophosphoryl diester phosphodiesterase (GDPDase)